MIKLINFLFVYDQINKISRGKVTNIQHTTTINVVFKLSLCIYIYLSFLLLFMAITIIVTLQSIIIITIIIYYYYNHL